MDKYYMVAVILEKKGESSQVFTGYILASSEDEALGLLVKEPEASKSLLAGFAICHSQVDMIPDWICFLNQDHPVGTIVSEGRTVGVYLNFRSEDAVPEMTEEARILVAKYGVGGTHARK